MISYHPASASAPVGQHFTAGFKTADTNDPERIARGITKYAWAPGIFRDGYRNKDNFICADWIGLDFEDLEFSLPAAIKAFCDMTHVIGTSRNHQLPKFVAAAGCELKMDRFRVLLKLDKRISSGRDFRWTMSSLSKKYPIDTDALDSARHFFRCREIVSINSDGYLQEALSAPSWFDKNFALSADDYRRLIKIKSQKDAMGWRLPGWLSSFLNDGRTVGNGRNATFFAASIELLEHGYSTDEILSLFQKSPYPRVRLRHREEEACLKSAVKVIVDRMGVVDGGSYELQGGAEEKN